MKISVLINSYNSISYLEETVESVLAQERLPDELIIVDDGSTDGSYELACQLIDGVGYARVVRQENGGQLSCVFRGVDEASGDILAILDSDDLWNANHLKEAERAFLNDPKLSLYYSAYDCFGSSNERWEPRYGSGTLGQTFALVMSSKAYIEGVSSSLVLRANEMKRFLPFPQLILDDWRINADNILVWLSSVTGGTKYANMEPTIRYRKHPENRSKKLGAPAFVAFRKLTEERFFEYLRRELVVDRQIANLLLSEYQGHDAPSKNLKKEYLRAVKYSYRELGMLKMIAIYWKILTH